MEHLFAASVILSMLISMVTWALSLMAASKSWSGHDRAARWSTVMFWVTATLWGYSALVVGIGSIIAS